MCVREWVHGPVIVKRFGPSDNVAKRYLSVLHSDIFGEKQPGVIILLTRDCLVSNLDVIALPCPK